ncbi:HAD family phosphatase [Stenotrophomonas sp.]|uniref:HAD family hydrolase n=1 Tax=Stenotrophomonas sp. TaxID=69392 RepID=UPI0028A964D5|nr:HAD family phosphatase [Stenotrophomonas sp.]
MPAFPFDAVLFDCDGVLVDSEPLTACVLSEMLSEQGWLLTPEQVAERFIGKAVAGQASVIEAHTGRPFTSLWLDEFRRRRNGLLESDLVEVHGAKLAVASICAATGGQIACASGADLQKVTLQLQKVGLAGAFANNIFSGQDVPRNKPYPDVYLAAAAALGASPGRCAVIEDTVTGTMAGAAAGAVVFGYGGGGVYGSTSESLLRAGAHVVFHRMEDLFGILKGYQSSDSSQSPPPPGPR